MKEAMSRKTPPVKKRDIISLTAFAIFIVVIVSFYLGLKGYQFWFDSRIERFIQSDSIFGILLINSDKENIKQKKVNFISVLMVNPALARIGCISFLPETRLNEKGKSLQKLILSNEIEKISGLISKFLTIEIPFYIRGSTQDIANAIDLMEGLTYFIGGSDALNEDRLVKGEFLLDGALVSELLKAKEKGEYSSVFRIYKHYSLFLNLWLKRDQKWNIIKNKRIFNLMAANLETNLLKDELYTISKLFLGNANWLPFFWEVPVKKEKNVFLVNKEAAALYFRDFKEQITKKDTKIFDKPPNLEVRNGTNIPNLAKKVRGFLSRKGFRVLEFNNADLHDYKHTILLDLNAKPFYLQSVANTLKIEKYYFAINRTLFTDLVLILGQDYTRIFSEEN